VLHRLVDFAAEWASVYANHAAVRTSVTFMHIAGLVGGGGCAIAADRATLIASRQAGAARRHQLGTLQATHRIVLFGLAIVIVSGVMLFAADIDTFLYSRIFWVKLALVTLLVVNGVALIGAERRALRDDSDAGWTLLRVAAFCSVLLWFLTTLAGAALPNIG
jgi:hypothetical protein